MSQLQIKEMTGAVQLRTQKGWCTNNGVEFRTANDGKLRILTDHVIEVFNPKARKQAKKPTPNWGAMKKVRSQHGTQANQR